MHALGADLNVYAYVSGAALRATDPQGLDLADFVRGMAAEAKESVVAAAKEVYSSAKADAAAIQAGTKSWSDVAKQQGTEIVKAAVGVKLVESAASTVKRVAKAPGQVSHALKAGSDYEAGRRALRPTLTAMEVAGAVAGTRVGRGAAPTPFSELASDVKGALGKRLRDPVTGRFVKDPASPASPYKFTDAQRRAAWRKIAEDPNSPLTAEQRADVQARGWRGPQRVNPKTGELETMELSHEPVPLREGGKEVVPRWPEEHAAVDPHRQLKKTDK